MASMIHGPWTWHDVKCELAKGGHTIRSLAANLGVTPQAISKVKHSRSERIEKAIAKAVRRDPHEIWPERYPRR